ncbi:MAG: hypothetical protein ACI9JN_000852, partial [Bacteroidia bacterium]
ANAAKLDSGTYYRIKWANSCGLRKTTNPAQLIVPTPKTLKIQADKDTINQTTSTQLTASAGFRSYNWPNGASTQKTQINGKDLGLGEHYVVLTVIDSNGCSAEDSIKITVIDKSSVRDVFTKEIVVYPNPVINTLKISISPYCDYLIHSTEGKLLKSGRITMDGIDVSALTSNALYFITLHTEKGTWIGRFLKVD